MKRIMVFTLLLVAIGLAGPTFAAPDAAPTTQPAAKVETKATPPATEVASKVDGKVEVAPKKVVVKAEATTETQSWWQNLLVSVIKIVGAIAVPVLSTLLIILLKRWNIKVEYEKVEFVAGKAKNYAEQFARNKLKEGKPLNAPEVAKIALVKGRELGEGKIASWAAKLLVDLIEAKCGEDNKDKPVTNGASG